MLKYLIAFLLGSSVAYAADSVVFRGADGAALRLFKTPCVHAKILAYINPDYHARFQAATLTWMGKEYASCWMLEQGRVLSLDETGDPLQPIPFRLFADDTI